MRKDAIKHILNLPLVFNYPQLVVETILGQMLRLPSPFTKTAYFSVLLAELIKSYSPASGIMPKALHFLFQQTDHMDMECRDRLADWFALYLSNLECSWDWAAWSEVASLPASNGRRIFVTTLISRLVRLYYVDYVKKLLPESLHSLLPSAPAFTSSPSAFVGCLFPSVVAARMESTDGDRRSQEEVELQTHAAELLASVIEGLKAKETGSVFLARIAAVQSRFQTGDIAADSARRGLSRGQVLAVVMEGIFNVGSKFISHALTLLQRYLVELQRLIQAPAHVQVTGEEADMGEERASEQEIEDRQCWIASRLYDCWRSSPLHVLILLERLVNFQLISPASVISWLLPQLPPAISAGDADRDVMDLEEQKKLFAAQFTASLPFSPQIFDLLFYTLEKQNVVKSDAAKALAKAEQEASKNANQPPPMDIQDDLEERSEEEKEKERQEREKKRREMEDDVEAGRALVQSARQRLESESRTLENLVLASLQRLASTAARYGSSEGPEWVQALGHRFLQVGRKFLFVLKPLFPLLQASVQELPADVAPHFATPLEALQFLSR
eukprot:GILI01027331.1.p1 GENE.GILI01027331.1~~GILI01027331.1.p1  ORF type:complete len:608 (-),score=202.50 GILI01027331.1:147-1820(-)